MNLVQCQTGIRTRMPNVNHQRASRPAATLSRAHSTLSSPALFVEQPPRLRARDPFAFSVDSTNLTMIPFTPPLHIHPLTAALGRKANWGGATVVPIAGQTTPALTATTMKRRALFPRATRFAREPSASWTPQGVFRVALSLFILGMSSQIIRRVSVRRERHRDREGTPTDGSE